MKNNGMKSRIAIVAVVFGIGWLCGYFIAQRTISSKIKEARNELFVAAYYQIDSLNRELDLNKSLIVKLASKLDSMKSLTIMSNEKPRILAASNQNTIQKNRVPKNKNSGKEVYLDTDADLDFFNSYIENEKDFDL